MTALVVEEKRLQQLRKLKFLSISSSHGRWHSPLDVLARESSPEDARKFLCDHFPKDTFSRAWGGLILGKNEFPKIGMQALTTISENQNRNRRELKNVVANSMARVVIHKSGSNELKSFMVTDEKKILEVEPWGLRVWNELPPGKKINFDPRRRRCLGEEAIKNIEQRVEEYLENLKRIYTDSDAEFVFHVSILERICNKDKYLKNCNIYFAYANRFLKEKLKRLNRVDQVKNRKGIFIYWHFLNVAEQFYLAENPILLFKPHEQKNGWMVHRNREAMEKLVDMYMAEVYKVLDDKI